MKAGGKIESQVRRLYIRFFRSSFSEDIKSQRIKLLWFIWGYYHVFTFDNLTLLNKLRLIRRFLKVDWRVVHAHRPAEISLVCSDLTRRRARNGEVMVEAGCYNGGSSAKFSMVCELMGYRLWIYDSFEGVEQMTESEKAGNFDFSGLYAATTDAVTDNIRLYGELGVCTLVKGWFSDTIARDGIRSPVRVAYIDCDLAKGTREVLKGVVPALTEDAVVFSQDYHIRPIIKLIEDDKTWSDIGTALPLVTRLGKKLVSIRFHWPA